MRILSAILLVALSLTMTQLGHAQSESDLAKKTQNPLADLISLPFQNNFDLIWVPTTGHAIH